MRTPGAESAPRKLRFPGATRRRHRLLCGLVPVRYPLRRGEAVPWVWVGGAAPHAFAARPVCTGGPSVRCRAPLRSGRTGCSRPSQASCGRPDRHGACRLRTAPGSGLPCQSPWAVELRAISVYTRTPIRAISTFVSGTGAKLGDGREVDQALPRRLRHRTARWPLAVDRAGACIGGTTPRLPMAAPPTTRAARLDHACCPPWPVPPALFEDRPRPGPVAPRRHTSPRQIARALGRPAPRPRRCPTPHSARGAK